VEAEAAGAAEAHLLLRAAAVREGAGRRAARRGEDQEGGALPPPASCETPVCTNNAIVMGRQIDRYYINHKKTAITAN